MLKKQRVEEPVDLELRNQVKKKLLTVGAIAIGLLGLSHFVKADPGLRMRARDGTKGSVMLGVNTDKLTVSSTEPSNPKENDIWIDTS